MRWILWLLTGAALMLAILLAIALLGLARLNPWLTRRLARSGFAVAALGVLCELGLMALSAESRE